MNFSDAAYQVLKNAGEPLHYREITRRAVEQGLVVSEGKTPEATLNVTSSDSGDLEVCCCRRYWTRRSGVSCRKGVK